MIIWRISPIELVLLPTRQSELLWGSWTTTLSNKLLIQHNSGYHCFKQLFAILDSSCEWVWLVGNSLPISWFLNKEQDTLDIIIKMFCWFWGIIWIYFSWSKIIRNTFFDALKLACPWCVVDEEIGLAKTTCKNLQYLQARNYKLYSK